jgi:hypothetical protein
MVHDYKLTLSISLVRQYWGEMGYMRIELGKNLLGIEGEVAWATPGTFTVTNYPCYENGSNCVEDKTYVDPSQTSVEIQRRLAKDKPAHRRTIRG